MKQIIRLSGKARQVFRLWAFYVQRQGNKSLGELVKGGEVNDHR
jgi:hypothetical protein